MFQISFQWNRNNFHIVVWMGAKSHSCLNRIVIQNPKGPEVHSIWIEIIRETKRMVGI